MDPFAASLVVPPPQSMQMSDLEKKQKLLMEEQLMWQQYMRDGMQGQYVTAKYNTEGIQNNTDGNVQELKSSAND